jgi:tRNA(Ile)-lysidine synthase
MDLLSRFIQNWNDKKMNRSPKPTLLAVSGGVDSMVMCHLFLKANFPFAVAHCNFQLRGLEADKDQQLVRDWCTTNNITFHTVNFDTQQKCEEWGKGIQETARILRYEWLYERREEHSYSRIATAHHADDNVETLLMNLFKGTGISGLHGIPELTDLLVRPLLFASKKDLLDYAAANSIPYRDDASNASDKYTRNTVRHHITPVIEQHFPGATMRINDSIFRFAQAEAIYRKAIDKEKQKLIQQRGHDFYIPIRKLSKRPQMETLCYEIFTPYGFTPAQLPHIIALMQAESGHYITSQSHRIIRNRDFLIITANSGQNSTDFIQIEGVPCNVHTPHASFHFSMVKKPAHITADPHIALIDMKRITFPIILRRWRTGDYFYPIGMGMKKKKLSRYLIDQKVPLHEKEKLWVLECDKRIAWISGMRLDERFKLTTHTDTVLMVEMKPL